MKIELDTICLGFNADNLKKGDHLIVKEGIAVGILPSEFINMLPKVEEKPEVQLEAKSRFVLFRNGKISVKDILQVCLTPASFHILYTTFPGVPQSVIRSRIYNLKRKGMVDVTGEGHFKLYQTNDFGKHYLDGGMGA